MRQWLSSSSVMLALVSGLAATSAFADAIPLVNAGFETPDLAGGDTVGWIDVKFNGEPARTGTFTSPAAPWAAFSVPNPEGTRVGFLDATSSISQDSNHALTAGESYSLSAWLGNRLNNTQRPTDLQIYADNGSGGLGALLASVTVPNEGFTNGTYQKFTVNFDTLDPLNLAVVAANLGRDLHVSFRHSHNLSGGGQVTLDGVEFSFVPVPEPASLALAGLAGLMCVSRRSRC